MAYPTTSYLALWKVFRHQKGIRLRRIWECHDCHEGVVIPGTYKSIHGETVKIDPKNLDPNTEVMRFWLLFHGSNIPSFHVGGTKPVSLKAACFQYIIEIPRRLCAAIYVTRDGDMKKYKLNGPLLSNNFFLVTNKSRKQITPITGIAPYFKNLWITDVSCISATRLRFENCKYSQFITSSDENLKPQERR